MARLQDKVAIITGAGQGIGLAYAQRFLAEGAKVVVAEINEERAEGAMKTLAGDGPAIFVQTDISDEASANACAAATIAEYGRIDILVNNAALYFDIEMQRNDYEYLQRVFRVNLHGQWLMARAVAPSMVAQRFGRIINQASAAAYLPNMMQTSGEFVEVGSYSYSQTKWGVVGLTKFLASELGRHNITVNCVAPGVTMTEATKKAVPPEMVSMLPMMSAMKTTLEAEDITGSAVFFASDDARLVTGQVLCVDAGTCMPG